MRTEVTPEDRGRLRELAAALDCLTEDEHLLLSGWSIETAKAKRKRGEGPPYIRHGNNFLYPRKPYAEYLQDRVRERARPAARSVL